MWSYTVELLCRYYYQHRGTNTYTKSSQIIPVQTETTGVIAAVVSHLLQTLTDCSGKRKPYPVERLYRHYQHQGADIYVHEVLSCTYTKSYQKIPVRTQTLPLLVDNTRENRNPI